jgi:site-specific recombinase XerD
MVDELQNPLEPAQGELAVDERELEESNRRIRKYLDAAIAENTKRAYRADLEDFVQWCNRKGRRALPAHPHTVADYVATLAETGDYKATTLMRRCSALRHLHGEAGELDPFRECGQASYKLRRFLQGIRRELGMAVDKKTPAVMHRLRRMVLSLNHDHEVREARDKAILLVGMMGAFRRSELVGLDVEHLDFSDKGVVLRVVESKTDQEARGAFKGIHRQPVREMCGVRALERWLELARITNGPVFRGVDRWGNVREKRLSGHSVARVVKRAAEAAGLDPDDYGAHSLRSGLVTQQADAHSTKDLMDHTGHRSAESLREYMNRGRVFQNNVTRDMFKPDGFWRAYRWFLDHYQRPHGVVPRGEGGWQWRDGEPYRARDVLEIRYGGKIESGTLAEVAAFLEDKGTVWVKREGGRG